VALEGENSADVDRDVVDGLESRLQKIIALVEAKRYGLTARETEVWQLRRGGVAYKEIAAVLTISVNTVKRHLQAIYSKMGL
jgi:DNA-binding NarL/FixJ family response regulator